MKVALFVVGALASLSAVSGFIFLIASQHSRVGEKHGEPSTFRDLYEDNAPSDDIPYDYDYTEDFLRFY